MSPAGAIVALAICFVVALLAQRHGRELGRHDLLARDAHVARLTRLRDQYAAALNLTLDAFDTQRALAERRFSELVEAEAARDRAVRQLRDREAVPTRVVAGPRADWWT